MYLKCVPSVMLPLIIVEGTVLDYHLHFKVSYGKFLQKCEVTKNDMSSRAVDALTLGPNSNLEVGIKWFSLDSGRVLLLQWRDTTVCNVLISAINRVKCMCEL